MTSHDRPMISTVINTTALALTSFGVVQITTSNAINFGGYVPILFGMALEWFKYWGMKHKLW